MWLILVILILIIEIPAKIQNLLGTECNNFESLLPKFLYYIQNFTGLLNSTWTV
jgi:hypothetical protein